MQPAGSLDSQPAEKTPPLKQQSPKKQDLQPADSAGSHHSNKKGVTWETPFQQASHAAAGVHLQDTHDLIVITKSHIPLK